MNGNTVLGYTEGYASPEQYIIALDSREGRELPQYRVIDEKSDIYSTGATLFHLITGKKAGRNRTKAEEYLLKNYVSEAFAAVILKQWILSLKRDIKMQGKCFRLYRMYIRKMPDTENW